MEQLLTTFALPFLAEAPAVQTTEFEWGNPMPAWLIFTIVVGMAALVIRSYMRESGGAALAATG